MSHEMQIDPHGNTVAVLGATGQQGGAVAAALSDRGWSVRAVVRDPGSTRARALSAAGAEVVAGDLDDRASLRAAFAGAHGVFSVQPSSGQSGSGVTDEDEVAYGIAVADAAEQVGVEHLVYSSAIASGRGPTGLGHFDTKTAVEAHVRERSIPSTVLRPATFVEILLVPGTIIAGGHLSFLTRPDQAFQVIAVRDIGRIAAEVFGAGDRYVGDVLEIAGDVVTGDGLARAMSGAAGRPIAYQRLPDEVVSRDPLLGALTALFDDGRLAGHADLDALRRQFPFLLGVEDWLAGSGADLLHQALTAAPATIALR